MAATPTATLADEVAQTLAAMPIEAQQEVLDFARFVLARIAAADAEWDAAFAATDPKKLQAWLDEERAADEDLQPLFDDTGAPAL
jgi:hypothetical protein